MSKWFLPDNYKRDPYLRVSSLSQGHLSVEEYIQEFEQLQIKSGIEEEPEQTMARFIMGLEPSLVEKVDIRPYWCFEDACKSAIKVEKHSKRRGVFNHPHTKPAAPLEPSAPSKPKIIPRAVGSQDQRKAISKEFPKQLDGKKCFKCQGYGHFITDCPNRRVLTLKEMEEIDQLTTSLEKEKEEEEKIATVLASDVGDLLVIERTLHTQKNVEEEDQREHIFHSCCTIQDKVCDLIIDGGSYANVASTQMVSKLNLPTTSHPRPYSLPWLEEGNEVHATKQAVVSYYIGGFWDEVLSEVLPMDACHLLLGRPRQFYKEAIHNGRTNSYSFKAEDKSFVFNPFAI